jgi:tetraacyldisaccharide 4'-kinase
VRVSYRWIHRVWYEGAVSGLILLPLTGLYWIVLQVQHLLFRCGLFRIHKAAVPVIVVGNITAGGTGKTPTVLWLVEELRARGFTPGIVSRGYGGSHSGTSMRVDADSAAAVVGDEPVLLAKRGQCPVVVDSDRFRAANMLIEDGVDVIISDDGLQHLRLHRDYEICVIDASRGLGNKRLLPAGPLRESARRLHSVDLILSNGGSARSDASSIDAYNAAATDFVLQAGDATRINGSLARPLQGFKDITVHAVAGIGNPTRFFDLLRGHGIQVIEHSLPDHAALTLSQLQFGDDFEVFMTEKDAVKLQRNSADKYWYVPVHLTMDSNASENLINDIENLIRVAGGVA